jgi:hypothetical protein
VADNSGREAYLVAVFSGMVMGALAEAFGEMAKELRRYPGDDFNERLDALEAAAIRATENAAINGIPESHQVFLIEKTRETVAAIFSDARSYALRPDTG